MVHIYITMCRFQIRCKNMSRYGSESINNMKITGGDERRETDMGEDIRDEFSRKNVWLKLYMAIGR